MAKSKAEKPVTPDDEVRYTAIMRRADRAELKFWCEQRGLEMERVGTQWILERLEQEKRKGAKR